MSTVVGPPPAPFPGVGDIARPATQVPRTAFSLREAAESLGVSLSTFRRHVLPTIKAIRMGSTVVIPASELSRWVAERCTLNTPTHN